MVSKPRFPRYSHRYRGFHEHREILLDQSTRSPVDDHSPATSAVPVANVNRDRRENAAGGKEERKKKRDGKETSGWLEETILQGSRGTSRGEIGRVKCHIFARARLNVAAEALARPVALDTAARPC